MDTGYISFQWLEKHIYFAYCCVLWIIFVFLCIKWYLFRQIYEWKAYKKIKTKHNHNKLKWKKRNTTANDKNDPFEVNHTQERLNYIKS